MQLSKIKKTLLEKGLDEFSADELLHALKTSQKKVAFVATIKTTNRINDIVSVCFEGRRQIKKLDFYLRQLLNLTVPYEQEKNKIDDYYLGLLMA